MQLLLYYSILINRRKGKLISKVFCYSFIIDENIILHYILSKRIKIYRKRKRIKEIEWSRDKLSQNEADLAEDLEFYSNLRGVQWNRKRHRRCERKTKRCLLSFSTRMASPGRILLLTDFILHSAFSILS